MCKLLSGDNKKKKIQAPVTLTLCSFAVTRMAYSRITRLFKKYYKKQTGRDVRFRLSFGGSGVQARAVIDGLPADIVALALPLDVIKIEQVLHTWGFVFQSQQIEMNTIFIRRH